MEFICIYVCGKKYRHFHVHLLPPTHADLNCYTHPTVIWSLLHFINIWYWLLLNKKEKIFILSLQLIFRVSWSKNQTYSRKPRWAFEHAPEWQIQDNLSILHCTMIESWQNNTLSWNLRSIDLLTLRVYELPGVGTAWDDTSRAETWWQASPVWILTQAP